MLRFKRLLLQLLLWLFVWFLLWSQQQWNEHFLIENAYSVFVQISLLVLLIYFNAPRFLWTKKYLWFTLLSLSLIFLLSIIPHFFHLQELPHLHGPGHGPLHQHGYHPIPPPPPELVKPTLILLSYVVGTVIEIIVFAQKKEDEINASKNEHLETELKLLKAQINPHFLFNSLNNIYALSAIDTSKTQKSISHLSDMLRYVLYECEQSFVLVKNEIKYIENYIRLFSLKSSKEYPIELNLTINDTNIEIAPMLLIPFVENAFKHSNIEKITSSYIKMYLDVNVEKLTFRIENTFSNHETVKDKVGGIGLENVQRRLDLLYKDSYMLNITKDDQLFSVELNLLRNV